MSVHHRSHFLRERDGDSPPNSVRSRSAPVGARYHSANRWLQSGNSSALIHDGPSSSFISASHSMDCFAVRIPPAGLNPTAMPVSCAYSRIARVMTKPTGSVALVGSFPVEVLMKSAPAIMATKLARATLRSVSRSPVPRMTFICAEPAGLFERGNLVVKGLPFAAKHMSAGDDHIDIIGSRFDRTANFRNAFSQRRESCGKSGGDRGHAHAAAFERPHRRLHKGVIHADRGNFNVQFFNPQALDQIILNRMPGFGAQAAHALFSVIAGESGEVHAGDGAQQPCRLPIFLYGAARKV